MEYHMSALVTGSSRHSSNSRHFGFGALILKREKKERRGEKKTKKTTAALRHICQEIQKMKYEGKWKRIFFFFPFLKCINIF